MGWHKFLMKHGAGSPGYIAKRLAKRYAAWKLYNPSFDERSILNAVLMERIAAQTMMGGPFQYHRLKADASLRDELLRQNPDLYSIIMLSIFVEHPELVSGYVPADAFRLLNEIVSETLDSELRDWRTAGVWHDPTMTCHLCKCRIHEPNPSTMWAAIEDDGTIGYSCQSCALPLEMRAMSSIGFFSGR